MNQNSFNKTLPESILQKYRVSYSNILPVQSGYRNHSYKVELAGSDSVNLIIFKAETDSLPRIKRADLVSEAVSAAGLPARVRINPEIIKMQSRTSDLPRYAALYNYLPGNTISWEAYTKDHLKALGVAMARMHRVFANNSQLGEAVSAEADICSELNLLLYRIEAYFSKSGVQSAAKTKLNLELTTNLAQLLTAVSESKKLKNQHVLHMDFVRGNVLFSSSAEENEIIFGKARISGIIDFEKTSYGSPLFDIARTLAFLYVDCKYKSAEKVRKHFLYSGYMKYGGGLLKSKELLSHYVRLFLLHDFYKFLLHNPYEFLNQNEHFLRTRDILLEQNMIKYVKQD